LRTKFVLIAASIILAGSLLANAYFYALHQSGLAEKNNIEKQVGDLKNQLAILINQTDILRNRKASLETQLKTLEDQMANLQNQADNFKNENAHIRDENVGIQNRINQMKQEGFPKIVTRLGATDVRSSPAEGHPWSGVLRLYISGEVWNMGTASARDCRLHVTLYQGKIVANDTYVEMGTIKAGTYVDVAANIYYTGEALTDWTIIPENT
jgi:regulator of replication initiation timing